MRQHSLTREKALMQSRLPLITGGADVSSLGESTLGAARRWGGDGFPCPGGAPGAAGALAVTAWEVHQQLSLSELPRLASTRNPAALA